MKPPSKAKNFRVVGIVLKRMNVGETDRVVSLLTAEHGRLTVVAKGVRKVSSSNRALLEPGNYIQAYLIKTKTMPLLTQAKMIDDCAELRTELAGIRRLSQFLEILDRLFVEEELEPALFKQVLSLREGIVKQQLHNGQIKQALENLVAALGYQNPRDSEYDSVLDYVAALADRPMRSFDYLQVKKQNKTK